MEKKNDEKLRELAALEAAGGNEFVDAETSSVEKPEMTISKKENSGTMPNSLDGYQKIDKMQMPQEGILYPESWEFAYRCPTSKEVANFSTINEQDQPAIIVAIEDLIRKCVVIFDTDENKQINTGEINDAHRTFFMLLLRDYYLPGVPVQYKNVCSTCHDTFESKLTAFKLKYPELKEKLINDFDGRIFNLTMEEDVVIRFRIPTLETSGRIFKYIVKTYRNSQTSDSEKKEDAIVYDKQFLLVAPYLFINGVESIREIINKYKMIQKNDSLFKCYLDIINKLKLDNEEFFDDVCTNCGSEEETLIKFPGGWKKLFVSKKDTTGYFD